MEIELDQPQGPSLAGKEVGEETRSNTQVGVLASGS